MKKLAAQMMSLREIVGQEEYIRAGNELYAIGTPDRDIIFECYWCRHQVDEAPPIDATHCPTCGNTRYWLEIPGSK